MTTHTATTSTAAGIVPAAPIAEDRPAYRYAGNGTFLPANEAAHEECRLWNDFADRQNARTAARSLRRHDH